jgi:hypothetical protein
VQAQRRERRAGALVRYRSGVTGIVVEGRGFVLRRNWWPFLVCVVLFVGGVLYARTGTLADLNGPLGLLAAWFGIMLGPILLARGSFPLATPTAFRATEAGLTLEGDDEVRSEDILEAKLVPRRAEHAIVELALRGPGRKKLALRTGAREATALLQLFGARRTRFRLILAYRTRFLGAFVPLTLLFLGMAIQDGRLEQVLFMVPGCAFYAALLAWPLGLLRGSLVVGADGFTTKWLLRERFISFRDVAKVERKMRFGSGGVDDTLVELTKGRKMRLRTVEAPNTEEERGTESRAMLTHMAEAFERSERLRNGRVEVLALVRRGARSPGEWLSGIDALVRGGGSRYRVAAVSNEMLSELTSDPTAEVDARVGAAAALIRLGDDALRSRVRVAAEACADTDLRDTLLALSEARDDEGAQKALGLLRR